VYVVNTSDGLPAGGAALGEEFSEALGAVWFFIAGREALSGERRVAVGAGEALAVPRLVLVSHATSCDDLKTNQSQI